MKNVKSRDNLVIAGYFHSKTRTAVIESNTCKKQIGMYGKSKANSKCDIWIPPLHHMKPDRLYMHELLPKCYHLRLMTIQRNA